MITTSAKLWRQWALSAGLLALLAADAGAAPIGSPVELGSDGTVYRLWSGTYGELFGAEGSGAAQDASVLALDVVAPGQSITRHLIPGTESSAVETAAALLYDRDSNLAHVVWNERTVATTAVSRLELRSFGTSGWSDLLELSGGSQTDKYGLRLALTSDEYAVHLEGSTVRVPRRVLHLVWAEASDASTRAFYSPVVFIRGAYLGWNPVVALDELADPGLSFTNTATPPVVLQAEPTLVTTPTGRVTASFIQSQTHELVAVEVQALPGEIGELAEAARGHIVELAQSIGADNRNQLAEMARGHIVELAGDFHPSAASYLSDRTRDLIVGAAPATDAATLGEMARGHIVELGREILSGGLANSCLGQEVLLEIAPLDLTAAGPEASFSQFFALRRTARWVVPGDLTAPNARILVSTDGRAALVAWETEGHLSYREVGSDGTWSLERQIDLSIVSAVDAWDAVARRATGL